MVFKADCESNPFPLHQFGSTSSASDTKKFTHCEIRPASTSSPQTSTLFFLYRVYDRYSETLSGGVFTCAVPAYTTSAASALFKNPIGFDGAEPSLNNTNDQCNGTSQGNPFHVKTGVKFQDETDFQQGDLTWQRHYSSSTAQSPDGFGPGWRHGFSQRAKLVRGGGTTNYLVMYRAAGQQVWLAWNATLSQWLPTANNILRATETRDSSGNLIEVRLINEQGDSEVYTSSLRGVDEWELDAIEYRDGRVTTLTYDTSGYLATVADRLGREISLTWDTGVSPARIDAVTDARGTISSLSYDGLGRVLTAIQDTAGIAATSDFAYDPLDRLTQVEDPNNLDTDYTYNGYGDELTLSSPDTGTTTFTYDAAGRLDSKTDARSVTVDYTYDSLGRLTGVDYPTSSPDRDEAFFYDEADGTTGCSGSYPVGRLTRMTDETGETTWCYDHRGQITQRIEDHGGVVLTTAWSYDLAGRTVTLTYPSGHVVTYDHNTLGQIEQVDHTDVNTTTTTTLLDNATYLPFGPVAG